MATRYNRSMQRYRNRIRHVSPELGALARRKREELTRAEALLWEAIRGQRLDGLRFRCQHAVGTFIFDFYCPASKLVVEVDGGIHDLPDVAGHDTERDTWVKAHGYRVLRLHNSLILNDLPAALDHIRAAANQKGAEA